MGRRRVRPLKARVRYPSKVRCKATVKDHRVTVDIRDIVETDLQLELERIFGVRISTQVVRRILNYAMALPLKYLLRVLQMYMDDDSRTTIEVRVRGVGKWRVLRYREGRYAGKYVFRGYQLCPGLRNKFSKFIKNSEMLDAFLEDVDVNILAEHVENEDGRGFDTRVREQLHTTVAKAIVEVESKSISEGDNTRVESEIEEEVTGIPKDDEIEDVNIETKDENEVEESKEDEVEESKEDEGNECAVKLEDSEVIKEDSEVIKEDSEVIKEDSDIKEDKETKPSKVIVEKDKNTEIRRLRKKSRPLTPSRVKEVLQRLKQNVKSNGK